MSLPTAADFLHQKYVERHHATKPGEIYPDPPTKQQCLDMIEFTKLHVQAALKEAVPKAEVVYILKGDGYKKYIVAQDSILNAYPLENIK